MTIDPCHIRPLFLQPKPRYTPAEAAEALGWPVEEVLGWMEVGELEGIDSAEGVVLAWGELASFAMGFWDQEEIEAALGAEVARAIPELWRLAELEVRIPRLEIVALERLAARDGKSVDAVLARELLDVVSAQSHWLMEEIPGLAAALSWPS